jgi:glycosyltransferase involved in cell wall biosynthesis
MRSRPAAGIIGRVPRVVVSHPHAAQVSQQTASGMARARMLAAYVTGLALPREPLGRASRWLTAADSRLGNRLVRGVPPWRLLPLPAVELGARAVTLLGHRLPAGATAYDMGYLAHDLAVAALLPTLRPDVLYAWEDGALWSQTVARRLGALNVYELPALYYRDVEDRMGEEAARYPGAALKGPWREPLWKQARKDAELRAADVVVVPSEFARRSLEKAPVRPERVEVIPYGFPVSDFRARRERPAGPFTVLSVGRLELRKGTLDLLEAWRRAGLRGARLRIVGQSHLDERVLGRYRDAFEHVEALPRTALEREYHQADLLAFPTVCDAFGLVIQEAMAAGLPVVTTRCGGGPECVVSGETGFLVEERNPDALAALLGELSSQREALFEMGQRARAHAEAWTWREAGDATARAVAGHAAALRAHRG